MGHTCECEQTKAKREAEQAAWDDNWPNACHKCNAWGGESQVELVGEPGGPNAFQDMWDDCDKCVGEGKCPRCGTELFADAGEHYNVLFHEWIVEMMPCPECGWNWGQNAGDVRPDDFECWCWIADSDEEYKEEMG